MARISDKRGRFAFLAVLAAALLLRVAFFHTLDADPRFDGPHMDEHAYHLWATAWSSGRHYPLEPGGERFWRTPGYPTLLSIVYAFGDGARVLDRMRSVAVLQMGLGALAIATLAGVAARRWGLGTGVLAGGLALLHAPLLFFEGLLLPVAVATPALTLGGLALIELAAPGGGPQWAGHAPRPRDVALALLAGGLLGTAAAMRSNLLVAVVVGAGLLAAARATRRWLVPYAAGLALPLGAMMLLSYAHDGSLAIGGANGPMNMYFGYGEYGGPTFDQDDPRWGSVARQAAVARVEAAHELGLDVERVDRAAASRHFGAKALRWIAAHPREALVLACEKLLGVFTWRDLAVVAPMSASVETNPLLRALVLPFPLLAVFAFYGALRALAWPARRGAAEVSAAAQASEAAQPSDRLGGEGDRAAAWALAIALLPVLATALLFFTYTRFRVPAVPLLCLSAAWGVRELVRTARAREPGWWRAPVGVGLACIGLTALSWDPYLRAEPRRQRFVDAYPANSWVQRGSALLDRAGSARLRSLPDDALLAEAETAFRKAQSLLPRSGVPPHWLARIERDERGHWAEGCALFEALSRRYPDDGYPAVNAEVARCELHADPPDVERALRIFRRLDAARLLTDASADSYANALIRSGLRDEACAWIGRAATRPYLDRDERKALRVKAIWAGCLVNFKISGPRAAAGLPSAAEAAAAAALEAESGGGPGDDSSNAGAAIGGDGEPSEAQEEEGSSAREPAPSDTGAAAPVGHTPAASL